VTRGPTSSSSAWRRWLALAVVIAIVVYSYQQRFGRNPLIIQLGQIHGSLGCYPPARPRDYILAKNKVSSILGDEPKRYHVVFPRSDRHPDSFDVDVWKTQDWEGYLNMALLANDKLVLCDDTTETETQLSHLGDFFVPEDLKDVKSHSVSNFFCRASLWAA
jgi:hypothetical protein